MTSDESIRRNCQSRTAFEHHDYRRNIQLLHNGNIKIVKDFCLHSNGGCSQQMKRRPRLERAATGELEKIQSKEVSKHWFYKGKTHSLPPTPKYYVCMQKLNSKNTDREKKLIHLKYSVGKELYGYPGPRER